MVKQTKALLIKGLTSSMEYELAMKVCGKEYVALVITVTFMSMI